LNNNKILQRIEAIKLQREVVKNGGFNLIPWHFHFPKLAKEVPGLIPGKITTLFASTGAGKTRFAKYITILIPLIKN